MWVWAAKGWGHGSAPKGPPGEVLNIEKNGTARLAPGASELNFVTSNGPALHHALSIAQANCCLSSWLAKAANESWQLRRSAGRWA